MDEELVERVLRAVDLVPAGRVVSYGDVAELVGTGPRQIGAVMSRFGHHTCWWRVTNAAGDFPPPLRGRAFAHWADEGIVVKPNGQGCRIREYRAELGAWAERYESERHASEQEAGPRERGDDEEQQRDGADAGVEPGLLQPQRAVHP